MNDESRANLLPQCILTDQTQILKSTSYHLLNPLNQLSYIIHHPLSVIHHLFLSSFFLVFATDCGMHQMVHIGGQRS
ncbi:MAG: hypothetical protein ABII96_03620, partial [Candidatus Zixiibacteriota bacterium]